MGNELGTHSYTHPEDTNYLLKDDFREAERQAWLDAPEHGRPEPTVNAQNGDDPAGDADPAMILAAGGGRSGDASQRVDAGQRALRTGARDPEGLLPVPVRILEGDPRAAARDHHRRRRGPRGAGAGDDLGRDLQYVSYLSGGYAGVGAGYPGAFGFLDPAHTSQGLLRAERSVRLQPRRVPAHDRRAGRARPGPRPTSRSSRTAETPIIHFPWHDYGPTDWDTSERDRGRERPGLHHGDVHRLHRPRLCRRHRVRHRRRPRPADPGLRQSEMEVTPVAGEVIAR